MQRARRYWRAAACVVLAAAVACAEPEKEAPGVAADDGESGAEIDSQLWRPLMASVAAGDIEAMALVYHPDAVGVWSGRTTPITEALDRWGRDMDDAKAKGIRASVEFRFSSRLDNATTAFQTGIFRYSTDSAGSVTTYHVPFEALLMKHEGRWRLLMEHQLPDVTAREWKALAPMKDSG